MTIELKLVSTDHREHTGRHSRERKTVSLPTYEVLFDGERIGTVRRAMITRERRTGQNRYVDARWTSPGWMASGRRMDYDTRLRAVAEVIADARNINFFEAVELARTATVVK